tara:strand:- start:50245 stop:51246 length:1002 start_codon:yes stop_codon:yes gene_type:complete
MSVLSRTANKVKRQYLKYGLKYPRIDLNVSLTRICNAGCVMCPMHNQEDALREHMDEKTFRKVIDIYKKLGQDYMVLHSMGECLLHPKFKEYVDILHKEKFRLRISSNGLWAGKHKETLVNVDWFRVSTEGWDNESMMKYRKQKFDKVYSGVKEFYEYSRGKIKYPFQISLMVYPSMKDSDIQKMFSIWSEVCDSVDVWLPNNPQLSHEKKGPATEVPRESFGDYHYMIPKEEQTCEMGQTGAFIQPNGDVLPCCNDYAHLLTLGNIHKDNILSIVNSEMANTLREELSSGKPEKCGKCFKFYKFEPALKNRVNELYDLINPNQREKFQIHLN